MATRETEIKRASVRAKQLPPRDFKVLRVLVEMKAQWDTVQIQERWQPRSLAQLSAECGISKSTLALSLNHLQRHGWLLRWRHFTDKGIGGRGHLTTYQLELGTDCDCPSRARRAEPVSDAERMRRYRARKKGSDIHVTETSKESGIHVTKGPSVTHEAAGQRPDSVKEGADVRSSKEDLLKAFDTATAEDLILSKLPRYPDSWQHWPPDSIGEEVFDRAIKVLADAGMLPDEQAAA
jgi:DNA-binding MarR family transcriptional regulator